MSTPVSIIEPPEPDFAALRAKTARKRRLVVALGALILAGGASYAIVAGQRSARQESEALAEQLRGCLLEAPLEAGETPWGRFRRLQLRAVSLSDTDRVTKGNKLWPMSCREAAIKAQAVIKPDATPEQMAAFDKLIKFLSDATALSKDATDVLAPGLSALDAHVPGPIPAGKAALPKSVMNVDSLAALPALSKKGAALGRSYTEDNPGLALPVLVAEESLPAPLLCQFHEKATGAECRSLNELAAVKGHGLRLLGTSDEQSQTVIFAGKRGAEGVFVAGSATPVDKLYSYGGYAAKDGTVSVLGWDEEQRAMVLVQKPKEGAPVRTVLKPNFRVGNYFYSSQLLWDQVFVRGVTPDNERRLFNLPLAKRDSSSFELVDIGELPEAGQIRAGEEEQTHLTGCRTEQATVIRVRGWQSDFVTFRLSDKFTMPVQAPTWGVLGCHGTTATFVTPGFSSGGSRLYHASCTSAGCALNQLKADALDRNSSDLRPIDERDVQAVDLQGKLLTVWLAGERGGLRMRMAAPDLFAREPDVILFDDRVSGGQTAGASTLLGFRLYSRENFAVLLLSTMAGLHAFRIGPDGSVKPFEVTGGN